MVGRRQSRLNLGWRPVMAIVTTGLAVATVGCSGGPSLPKISDLNPFAEKEVPLPGKRVPIDIGNAAGPLELAGGDQAVVVPPADAIETASTDANSGNTNHGNRQLASSIRSIWSSDVGKASSSYGRITAKPVAFGGRVHTIDVAGNVTAFSISGGSVAWRGVARDDTDISRESSGGGVAVADGQLYAVTGFGAVAAFDVTSGKRRWVKSLSVPVRAAPAASDGRLFILATDGRTIALSGTDGTEQWTHRGASESATLVSSVALAIEGAMLVVPHASGEVIALDAGSGQPRWSESLARTRTASSLSSMSDAATPSIAQGTVYAVGHAGRMVATSLVSGERQWSLTIPSTNAPWVGGSSVFVVDNSGRAMAISRRDGKIVWTVQLPGSRNWVGPALAGGRLWVASDGGQLLGLDAGTGKVAVTQSVGAPVIVPPLAASGRLFLLTDKGKLIAFG